MPISQYLGRARRHPTAFAAAFLLVLNASIAWRLFRTEYTVQFGSLEPIFFALARYVKEHWRDPGWFPLWFTGMPFEYTYQPLLHYVVAFTAALSGWSEGRAYHFVLACGYAVGPVTLFFLARRLAGRLNVALTACVLYSLWSPSALLMREVRMDSGIIGARRLHSMVVWGDGPHVMGLTLLPLAMLLLHRAISNEGWERATAGRVIAAALSIAFVFLTNIPATISLGFAVIAYVLASAPGTWIRRGLLAALCSVMAYALVAPWVPLSALATMQRNVRWMAPEANMAKHVPAYLLLGLTMVALGLLLNRFVRHFYIRFAVLFTLLSGVVVLCRSWFDIYLIAQPWRFHLAMEMAICLLVASCVYVWDGSAKWLKIAVGVTAAVLCLWQYVNFRLHARSITQRASIAGRSEYKIAQWFVRNHITERAYAPGSDAFWLNTFADTPQLSGCCDQNLLTQAPQFANYIISSDDGAGSDAAVISAVWLKAMGVRYAVSSGPHSTEAYHALHHPLKFAGMFPEVWRDGDDVIYDVSPQLHSLAHFVRPEELVSTAPVNGIDIQPMSRYASAVTDGSRPPADLKWTSTRTMEISGAAMNGDVLSIQIPFHSGWRAEMASGASLPIERDALGLMALRPSCAGACEVKLTYDGGAERRYLRALMAAAWAAVIAALAWSMRRSRFKGSA